MRRTLVMHSQHLLGLGHLIRAFALAEFLQDEFDVTVLNGGHLPDAVPLPAGVECISLPAIELDSARALRPGQAGASLSNVFVERARMITDAVERIRPAIVLVDLFPFGRKKFRAELLHLLSQGRKLGARTVASVRDILVQGRADQAGFERRALETANEWIDLVLVHGRPDWFGFEDSFRYANELCSQLHYTGYVSRRGAALAKNLRADGNRVVVSAGGGRFGVALRNAAIEAAPLLRESRGLTTTIVAGPLLPDRDWRVLEARARLVSGLEIVRSVPDLGALLADSAASVSQCGYNTFVELITLGIPAVIVPFEAPGEDEQTRRAAGAERLGLMTHLPRSQTHRDELVSAVLRSIDAGPRTAEPADGARQSTLRIVEFLAANRQPTNAA